MREIGAGGISIFVTRTRLTSIRAYNAVVRLRFVLVVVLVLGALCAGAGCDLGRSTQPAPPPPACGALPHELSFSENAAEVHVDTHVADVIVANGALTVALADDALAVTFDVTSSAAMPNVGDAVHVDTTSTTDCGEGCDVGYMTITDARGVLFDGGLAYTRDERKIVDTIGALRLDPDAVADGGSCSITDGVAHPLTSVFHVDGGDVSLARGETRAATVGGVDVLLVSNGGSDAVVDRPANCVDCAFVGPHEIWSARGYAYRLQ